MVVSEMFQQEFVSVLCQRHIFFSTRSSDTCFESHATFQLKTRIIMTLNYTFIVTYRGLFASKVDCTTQSYIPFAIRWIVLLSYKWVTQAQRASSSLGRAKCSLHVQENHPRSPALTMRTSEIEFNFNVCFCRCSYSKQACSVTFFG